MGGELVRAEPNTSVPCNFAGGSVVESYPAISVDGPRGKVIKGVIHSTIPLICNGEELSVVVPA